mmetsp:Transcript_33043/g.45817  ORF Transcript_33043/g.45817 Transcript_33043/m.45817 type:complete len:160 (+) Transcript_33043:137-616(+)|eukprot:CAMPEP_0196573062 /NCGR_PEP_ID=MMETSP1081-20130531/3026_1 /TAXON_ID=36882 /ORGANISM="Pyramimonas amylifera, Strain CCMP720" /LENGTH=159 /DNA_ID=CAMNT_0041890631 /DNA_START=120 /DNA_END=599 /DNA_ORIENTATION=+
MGQGKKKGLSTWNNKAQPSKKLHRENKTKRKGQRSPNGLIVMMGSFIGACAWTLWGAFKKERENMEYAKAVRTRLASKPVVFSPHASCRMDCRFVGKPEVLSVLQHGRLNLRKSSPDARPCPRYALQEGRVQAVFADCYNNTPVVTVIDTVTNHECGKC